MIERLDLTPMMRACRMFKDENRESTVTAIIVPVKVSPQDDGGILIGWACNCYSSCYNQKCTYSRKGKGQQ
ncbi:MAG: hypothetical protein ACP5K8_09520 [Nitrososphaeria archaeon]